MQSLNYDTQLSIWIYHASKAPKIVMKYGLLYFKKGGLKYVLSAMFTFWYEVSY